MAASERYPAGEDLTPALHEAEREDCTADGESGEAGAEAMGAARVVHVSSVAV